MILIVVFTTLSLFQVEAIGQEAQDDQYHYRHLQNKQPYPYHEDYSYHHARHFPRLGYSKPRPKPCPTPCTCQETEFIMAEELKSLQEHRIAASLRGCTLATGSDKDELEMMRQVAVDFQPEFPNIPTASNGPVLWIGLATEPTLDPLNLDAGGPWGWTDGCTQYTENVFVPPNGGGRDQSTVDSVFSDGFWVGVDANESSDVADVGEHDGIVYVGIILYNIFPGAFMFDALDVAIFLDAKLPAMYECCKLYHSQKYVLGSPHKTNKKIVHGYTPYSP